MNVTERWQNPSCTANRIWYNGWLQLCPVLVLPKSYILTRSGFFQEFGAVSRTNVLRKPLYCAAGSLARIWWQEHSAKSDNREGNFLREEEILESLRVKKGCFKCAGWFAPWLCIHSSSWSVFAALQKGTFTENQWHHISVEPVPSAGEQSNLWQLHTIQPSRLTTGREESGRCLPASFHPGYVSTVPGKPDSYRLDLDNSGGYSLDLSEMYFLSAVLTYHALLFFKWIQILKMYVLLLLI